MSPAAGKSSSGEGASGRRLERCLAGIVPALGLALLALLQPAAASATNHLTRIEQLLVGANGDNDIQFLEMKFNGSGQNAWGPQPPPGDSRALLTFHNASGTQTGSFEFATDPPVGPSDPANTGNSVLIATQAFVDATGLAVDFLLPSALMSPESGMVCFEQNPLDPFFPVNECLSYGSYLGAQESDCVDPPFGNICCQDPPFGPGETLNGPPAAGLSASGAPQSLNRFQDLFGDFECGQENSDFQLEVPIPRNSSGATFEMAAASNLPALSDWGLLLLVSVLLCTSGWILRIRREELR